ncbi:MAG: radical SAM protein [Patescibacteria group bacterium]|jgi:MoaA/NifB/PqqE/SkfB family radical SAM enzyme
MSEKLERIGFYTLSDDRCKNASEKSTLQRVEIIITDKCNFKCKYCKGLPAEIQGTMSFEEVKKRIDTCGQIDNIRFSGGEPTMHPKILDIVSYAKNKGSKRIAVSTNGSADIELYNKLISAGVNDFSISLDSCCAAFGEKMMGVSGYFQKVVNNIRDISRRVYTTIGLVVTEDNIDNLKETIIFASELGVADIRIISAAQYNRLLETVVSIPENAYKKYPILNYRINNIKQNRNVRGICLKDARKCNLVLDDIAIAGNFHFPCIIYMRERGKPIGAVNPGMRKERAIWAENHNIHEDDICRKNCLDVCIDYNNKFIELKKNNTIIPELDGTLFGWLA